MSRKCWTINNDVVLRNGQPIARIVSIQGRLGFRGLVRPIVKLERVGFSSQDELLEDVKYFYHHPPLMVFRFASGRQIAID